MTREIKFRAWIGKMEKMSDEVTVKYDGSFSAVIDGINGYSTSDGGVLMQFTGLHDKNEKEIYEGDILQIEWLKPGIVEVKWNVQGWSPFVEQGNTEWKIIGNVYENPELLTN